MTRVEELGSGIRKMFKYTPLYSNGKEPNIDENDIFRIKIPYVPLFSLDGQTTQENGKTTQKNIETTQKNKSVVLKTKDVIIEMIRVNPSISLLK